MYYSLKIQETTGIVLDLLKSNEAYYIYNMYRLFHWRNEGLSLIPIISFEKYGSSSITMSQYGYWLANEDEKKTVYHNLTNEKCHHFELARYLVRIEASEKRITAFDPNTSELVVYDTEKLTELIVAKNVYNYHLVDGKIFLLKRSDENQLDRIESIDLQGNLAWFQEYTVDGNRIKNYFSRNIYIADDVVIYTTGVGAGESEVDYLCFDQNAGELLWNYTFSTMPHTMSVDQKHIYLVYKQEIIEVDVTTGSRRQVTTYDKLMGTTDYPQNFPTDYFGPPSFQSCRITRHGDDLILRNPLVRAIHILSLDGKMVQDIKMPSPKSKYYPLPIVPSGYTEWKFDDKVYFPVLHADKVAGILVLEETEKEPTIEISDRIPVEVNKISDPDNKDKFSLEIVADHSDLNKVIIHGEIHVIEIEYSFGFKEAETGFYDPGFNNQVFYRVKDQPTFPDDTVDQLKQMENRLNTFIGNHSKVTVELI